MKCISSLFIVLNILSSSAFAEEWRCNVADQGGHIWTSTGSTQDRASAVASNFCKAYSPNGGSCQVSDCLVK